MTGNPALNENTFAGLYAERGAESMTVQGVVHKTAFLLLLCIVAASYTWGLYYAGSPSVMAWTIGGAIAGFVIGLVTIFKKEWSPVTGSLYAICEGLFVGGISSSLAGYYHGMVIEAVMLTFGVLAALLAAYSTGLIKATDNFKRGVVAATGGIALLYLATLILSFFHIQIPLIYGSGVVGIIFSLVVVIIAAMNLVLDFDFIEQGVHSGAPRYLEWYAAFSLLVTLVWLYLEILRLLAKLNQRTN
jgi:uncharacterized YccA/Bax inhibitor family protein